MSKKKSKAGRRKRSVGYPVASLGSQSKPGQREDRPDARVVILVGFMGAGKTSVGRAMSKEIGWKFEDLDARIEERERRNIADIFREVGEAGFRSLEHAALRELLDELSTGKKLATSKKSIIALGGGAFAQSRNIRLIRSMLIPTVFLEAGALELWRRCQQEATRNKKERPLVRDLETFSRLYKTRESHYRKATLRKQTEGLNVQDIALELIQALGLDRSLRK